MIYTGNPILRGILSKWGYFSLDIGMNCQDGYIADGFLRPFILPTQLKTNANWPLALSDVI